MLTCVECSLSSGALFPLHSPYAPCWPGSFGFGHSCGFLLCLLKSWLFDLSVTLWRCLVKCFAYRGLLALRVCLGYPSAKKRSYNWSEKAKRRHTTGTGR